MEALGYGAITAHCFIVTGDGVSQNNIERLSAYARDDITQLALLLILKVPIEFMRPVGNVVGVRNCGWTQMDFPENIKVQSRSVGRV